MKNPITNLFTPTSGEGLLKKPGDKFTAEITPSGLGVTKLKTSEVSISTTYYPTTGTKVTTTTEREK